MTPATKKLRNKFYLCKTLSILFNIIPIVFFEIKALSVANEQQYYNLILILTVAVILFLANFIIEYEVKFIIILLFVLSVHLTAPDLVKPMLIVLGIVSGADELLLTPFALHFKEAVKINKVIDKRGELNA